MSEPASQPQPAPASRPQPAPASRPQPAPASRPQPAPASRPQPAPASRPQPAPASRPQPAPASRPQPAPASRRSPASQPAMSYRGRYNDPVPTSNSLEDDSDPPEFEPFDDEEEIAMTPRAPQEGVLSVVSVDMRQEDNKREHHTDYYDHPNLVVRRCQELLIHVKFNRPLTPDDDIQLEFRIGAKPSVSKGSLVIVPFSDRPGGQWTGRVIGCRGPVCKLGITPSPNAIVGRYRTYVGICGLIGIQRTKRDTTTDLYVIFNAWAEKDAVFLPDEVLRTEYVLNECGVIYQGTASEVSHRCWMYGQFERGILDACICILDSSRMPIHDRGNAIKLVRKGSAMLNSQDDNGVLVGNWSDDYSMGTSPTLWTGSVRILLQYANTGVPVNFAQCWVFAGVFNTFLRCLGIPSRVVTNFSSAHDNTGNLKTDLIFTLKGTPDKRNTRDSIWNYHCWNEVFMTRPDLPAGLGGWQVVDATPQETSDGHYRCGPASVTAIKEGLVCHPFDAGFVFAEVNSDVVFHQRTKYGTLKTVRVDKTHVGQSILTKGVKTDTAEDVVHAYKYHEGSAQDERTMERAEEFGCERDHSDLPPSKVSVTLVNDPVFMGQDFSLFVDFKNQGGEPRKVGAKLLGQVVFYTGVEVAVFKKHALTVIVQPYQTERVRVKVLGEEYMPQLKSQLSLNFVLTGQSDDQSLSALCSVHLKTPSLNITASGATQRFYQMYLTVSFTNPFDFNLDNVYLAMEGPGLIDYCTKYYSVIGPHASIRWTEVCIPRIHGPRRVFAVLDSSTLKQVYGICDVTINS